MTEEKQRDLIVKVNELKGYIQHACSMKKESKKEALDMIDNISKILRSEN